MKTRIVGLLVALGLATASSHAAVIYVANVGTAFETSGLTGFATSGNQLAGMDVTVTFSDDTTKQGVWADLGGTSGGTTVANWFSLTQSGDTFSNAWTLTNLSGLSIKSLSLFSAPGNGIFDRTNPNQGTTGSAQGQDFIFTTGSFNATATYSDILNLTGSPATGDLYVSLKVDFDPGTLLGAGSAVSFLQDADSAAVAGTIVAVPDTATTALLTAFAFLGLIGLKRRLA